MYDLPAVSEDATIGPGSNLLIVGPPLSGKRQLALDVLASGATRGDGSIVVTTKDSAGKVLAKFDERLDDVNGETCLGVVDCVTKQRGVEIESDPQVKYVSSPVDMTGIGISLSEFLQEFYEVHGRSENRILLHSVSTLLMYSDLQTVFRFLHVFTGRVQSANALGVYVIDSAAHDDQTMNTLKQLFDAVVEVDDDRVDSSVRTTGISL